MRAENEDAIAKALYLFPREVREALDPLPDDAPTTEITKALVGAVRSVLWARARQRANFQPKGETPLAQALLMAERAAVARVHGINWAVLRNPSSH